MQTITTQTWADYKETVITKKQLPIQYETRQRAYTVFAQEGLFMWTYTLLRDGGADVVDFEANVKPTANS